MGQKPVAIVAGLLVVMASTASCRAPRVAPSVTPGQVRMAQLWDPPADLADRDLFRGGWGAANAPDPSAIYTFVRPKEGGTNPGVVVRDPEGRTWHVKQPSTNPRGSEGPVEVTLARVLEALGYHQPPVYFLSDFALQDARGTHREVGGRFRLDLPALDARGDWSWHDNPFVGTKPYQGLLVVLLMFNSTDLKDSNNVLYRYRPAGGDLETWYVVRDLGAALGETGRFEPRRNNIERFEALPFIREVHDGFVRFEYHGRHQELVENRLTPADVAWACDLAGRLSEAQWQDAFRAGGYPTDVADRYIRRLRDKIAEGRALGGAPQESR